MALGQIFKHEKTWMFKNSMNSIHFTCCSGIFLIVVISLVGLRSAEMPVGKKVHILWQGQKIWRHLPLSFDIKVHIFWEGHKILQNLHCRFVLCRNGQIYSGEITKFCGLLRIYELYLVSIFVAFSENLSVDRFLGMKCQINEWFSYKQ